MIRKAIPIAVVLLALPVAAHAQEAGAVVDQVVRQFQGAMAGWEGTLQTIAEGTFGILALITLALNFGRLALQKADFNDFVTALVQQILYLGLFWWLLMRSTLGTRRSFTHSRRPRGRLAVRGRCLPGTLLRSGSKFSTGWCSSCRSGILKQPPRSRSSPS